MERSSKLKLYARNVFDLLIFGMKAFLQHRKKLLSGHYEWQTPSFRKTLRQKTYNI